MNTDTELLSLIRHFAVPFSTEPANVPAHLQPIPGIRAVLFDVYGTLVSSASGDIVPRDRIVSLMRFSKRWIISGGPLCLRWPLKWLIATSKPFAINTRS